VRLVAALENAMVEKMVDLMDIQKVCNMAVMTVEH
jgi:hypothetical protein